MSLTAELGNPRSPTSVFFKTRLGHVRGAQRTFREALVGASTIKPGSTTPVPWGTVGTALDYRIRLYFDAYDPTRTVAYGGSRVLVGLRTLQGDGPRWLETVDGFFADLVEIIRDTEPPNRRLGRAAEDRLNRYCFALALLEQFARGNHGMNSPLLTFAEPPAGDRILALADGSIRDLRLLSWAFFDRALPALTGAFVLNPTFAGSALIGGADADLIVRGRLVEIKTTIRPSLSQALLFQMVGYALLDLDDTYGIDSVTAYMGRQSTLVTWSLDSLLTELADGPCDLSRLRSEFETMLASRE